MKVLISKSIFENSKSDQEILELNFLVHLIMLKDCCELIIDDSDILNTEFVESLNDNDTRLFQESFSSYITSSAKSDCIVDMSGASESRKKIFSRAEAIKYLLQPLSLLVENSLNDAYFLRALFRSYDEDGTLLNADQNNWLQFDNAGGCSNVENYLKAQVAHFQGKTKFLRYWIMLDGDKRFPTQNITKYDKLVKKLKEWNVEFHILDKRCMENYLPTKAVELIKSNKKNEDWVNAYLSLSDEQKDFLNIGGGFMGDLCTENRKAAIEKEERLSATDKKRRKRSYVRPLLDSNQQAFYADVSPAHFKALENGPQLSGKFKDTFPRYFEEAVVNKRSLNERVAHQANPDELKEIVNTIKNLL